MGMSSTPHGRVLMTGIFATLLALAVVVGLTVVSLRIGLPTGTGFGAMLVILGIGFIATPNAERYRMLPGIAIMVAGVIVLILIKLLS